MWASVLETVAATRRGKHRSMSMQKGRRLLEAIWAAISQYEISNPQEEARLAVQRHSTAAETPIKVHIQATLRSRTQPLEGYYGRGTLTSVLL
jgi:hypothetical protein